MSFGTGVGVVFGPFGDPGSYRVILNIFADSPKITVPINNRGVVSALPEPSRSSFFPIEVLGVAEGDALHQFGKTIVPRRPHQQVNMVLHEAIGKNGSFFLLGVLFQERKIRFIVLPTQKDLLLIVTPLNDVMGVSGSNYSRDSWHNCTYIPLNRGLSRKMGCVPIFIFVEFRGMDN